VVGMCIFSYGNSGGWEGCDYSQKGVFKALLRDYAIGREPLQEGQPPVEPNEPVWESYKVVNASGLNIRPAPAMASAETDKWNFGDEVVVNVASATNADGYQWMQHDRGWSAIKSLTTDWVGMEPLPAEEPEEPDEPQDPPTGEPFTDDQMTVLAGLINVAVADAMQQQQATIAAAVEEAMKPYRLHAATMEQAWGSLTGYTIEDAA